MLGAFAPLTRPGFAPAGRHLRAGLELGLEDINEAGGIEERKVALAVQDTRGDPGIATAALRGFHEDGVVAVAGEFHSAVARPLAELAHALQLPFVCSSATLDRLTSEPTSYVARLAPPQSYGWRIYADHLAHGGHRHIALALDPDEYWSAGAGVVDARARERGIRCTAVDVTGLSSAAVADRVAGLGADALLLLVAWPEPLQEILRQVRSDARLAGLLVGDPAGRADFREWAEQLGDDGTAVPYLRYLPPALDGRGADVAARLARRLGERPSFVALEGYDTVRVLGEALRVAGPHREGLASALAELAVPGTRGLIRFSRTPGVPVLQWVWPPVEVVASATSRSV